MSNAANPYAPPAARVDDAVGVNSEAEAIRKAHISHEASVKSVGILYYLGGAIGIIVAVVALFAGKADLSLAVVPALILAAFGVGGLFTAWGIRALRRWAQVVGSLFAALGLLNFPVGTLINLYILYLFLSKKGRTIFSPAYQDVIAATPHVKYRTSIIVWIFLALLIALLVFAFALPMFKR